ncbi:MAG: hypothetical protein D6704_03545 [Nitrospirae bacterium]|nr:MAG: hypothetical protein D6704_03545 [Nitrospirota bacterium]
MLDQTLLAILCCPETKQPVSLVDEALLAKINYAIERGELRNHAGALVKEKLDGGLIRADQRVVYPIRDRIPVMLIDESIPVQHLIASGTSGE